MIGSGMPSRGRIIKVNPLTGRMWIGAGGESIACAKPIGGARQTIDDLVEVRYDGPTSREVWYLLCQQSPHRQSLEPPT